MYLKNTTPPAPPPAIEWWPLNKRVSRPLPPPPLRGLSQRYYSDNDEVALYKDNTVK